MTSLPVLTSVHGRNLGLDRYGYPVAEIKGGFRNKVTAATSVSTGTTIPAAGYSALASSTTQGWTLEAPVPGVLKVIALSATSTSTAARTITLSSGNFQTTASATYTSFSWIAAGGSIVLAGVSTSRYAVLVNNAATLA